MDKAVILIYHRVASLEQDPWQLAVQPHYFEEHIKYLKDQFRIISLNKLIERLSAGKSVGRSVAITFDDGYADNYLTAKPILEKYRVPATMFVTAGLVGGRREFWWDELERILLTEAKPEQPLKIEIGAGNPAWNFMDSSQALHSCKDIHRILKSLPFKEREKVLKNLFRTSSQERNSIRDSHRILSAFQLKELTQGGLITVGSHGLTHTALSVEPVERQWDEISESKKILEDMTGATLHSFSYPFGARRDISDNAVQFVKRAGYACGISNIQGEIIDGSDVYLLPRRLVRDWSISTLKNKMAKWLDIPGFDAEPKPLSRDIIKKAITHYLENPAIDPSSRRRQYAKEPIRNLLSVNTSDSRGGAATLCTRLSTELRKRDYTVSMLVGKESPHAQRINRITPVDTPNQKILSLWQQQEGLLDLFHYSSLSIMQRPEFKQASVIHFHNVYKDYFSLLSLPHLSSLKPTVMTLHDMSLFTGHCRHSYDCNRWMTRCEECPDLTIPVKVKKDNTELLWKIKKIINDYSDFTAVCPSEWMRSNVERSLLQDKEIVVIPNGVDVSVFRPYDKLQARKRLNLPERKKILFFSGPRGFKNRIKGGFLISEIVSWTKRNNILLIVIGAEASKEDGLWILPFIHDEKELALYYSAANLLLHPSLADNCPLSILEALACGTPVITFRTGGIPEIVIHGETGYLAHAKDLSDLICGIEYFLNNPQRLKEAEVKSRHRVLSRFTHKRMTDRYIEIYEARNRCFWERKYIVDDHFPMKIQDLLNAYLAKA